MAVQPINAETIFVEKFVGKEFNSFDEFNCTLTEYMNKCHASGFTVAFMLLGPVQDEELGEVSKFYLFLLIAVLGQPGL